MSTRQKWEVPEQQPYKNIEHQWIPMQDKIRLSARLWIPDQASKIPVPVVLEYIPYRKRDTYRIHDNEWGKALASHGIAFARVDVRGTGDSEGTITDEYTTTEINDGVRCIEWLSRQPWCNGNVGMRGISWGAINTLQIAAMQPAALKAIIPIAGTDNRFTDDAHYIGGILGKPNLEWGVLFKCFMATPPDPDIVGDAWKAMWWKRLESVTPIITKWISHQRFDEYWQRGSVAVDYSLIKCPSYLVGGWKDTYSNTIGRLLAKLDVPRKGLIGPWGHIYPEMATPVEGLDWRREEIRWWCHWLLDEDTGIMAEPMLQAFMPYQASYDVSSHTVPGRWISDVIFPRSDIVYKTFRLNADGLNEAAKKSKVLTCPSDSPVGLTKPEWLNVFPALQNADDLNSLVFDSAILSEDFEMMGYATLRLRISANKPVAFIVARLTEVSPEGASRLVSYGLKNLSHHKSSRHPEAIIPGEFYDVSFQLNMTAHRFKAGHRIRLAISNGLWPLTWPSPYQVSLKLCSGVSSLELPIRSLELHSKSIDLASFDESTDVPASYSFKLPDKEGWYIYKHHPDPVRYNDADTGTTLTTEQRQVCRLKYDKNIECSWHHSIRMGWQRDNWHCEITADCELTSSPSFFHVCETLNAYQDSRLIFEHSSDEKIKRDFL